MYPRVSMLMNTAELCAVFIVRRGLAWSTSRSLSLLLFLFLGFFRTVKRGEVYSPAEIFFCCPVRVFSNVSTDVQARKHRSFCARSQRARRHRHPLRIPGSGPWPGRGKATNKELRKYKYGIVRSRNHNMTHATCSTHASDLDSSNTSRVRLCRMQ